jgi:hypothetical protein
MPTFHFRLSRVDIIRSRRKNRPIEVASEEPIIVMMWN